MSVFCCGLKLCGSFSDTASSGGDGELSGRIADSAWEGFPGESVWTEGR